MECSLCAALLVYRDRDSLDAGWYIGLSHGASDEGLDCGVHRPLKTCMRIPIPYFTIRDSVDSAGVAFSHVLRRL